MFLNTDISELHQQQATHMFTAVKVLFTDAEADDVENHTNEYQTYYFLLPSSAVCLLQVVLCCFLLQIIEIREDLISRQVPLTQGPL
jgi:hypothetical protein